MRACTRSSETASVTIASSSARFYSDRVAARQTHAHAYSSLNVCEYRSSLSNKMLIPASTYTAVKCISSGLR